MRIMTLAVCIMFLLYSQVILGADSAEIQELRALVAEQGRMMREQNAKMAAQDARLADLHAKMAESGQRPVDKAKGVVSLRKNAAVTVGGMLNTKYVFSTGDVEHGTAAAGRKTVSDYRIGSLSISEARLAFDMKVNDHFEALLQLDLQQKPGRTDNTSGIIQKYYMHWKNIRDTGFGLLIGRNNFIFSDRFMVGEYSGLLGRHDDFTSIFTNANIDKTFYDGPGGKDGEGMFSGRRGRLVPNYVGWDYSRTTQINPYWESEDGKLRLDLTLMQSAERLEGDSSTVDAALVDGVTKVRSINYGLGSGTFRVMWKPLDGLTMTGSVANFYQNNQYGGYTNVWDARRGPSDWALGHPEWISGNATAANLSFNYTPVCADAWTFWGKWTHGWNDGWTKDLDSDGFNLGLSYTFRNLTLFAQGDYFTNRNKRAVVENWYRADIWAFYTGLTYSLPYGVSMELGWRHEESRFKNRAGYTHPKGTLDSVYGHVGLLF
jgi:hypothetical protein